MGDSGSTNRLASKVSEGGLGRALAASAIERSTHAPEAMLTRVVVQEVIYDPTMIDDQKTAYINSLLHTQNNMYVPMLPPNTIIGKAVRDGTQSGVTVSELFFPFLPPHLMMPVKAGEHVWVFYEQGKECDYGYWMWRVTDIRSIDDLNYTHNDRKFDLSALKGLQDKASGAADDEKPGFPNGPLKKVGGQVVSEATGASLSGPEAAYETLLKDTDSAAVSDFEDVPRFKKRPPDIALQGSNNTLIVLGTDRTGAVADTKADPKMGNVAKGKPTRDRKGKAGAIDVVVGRGQGGTTKPTKVVTNTMGKQEVSKNVVKENRNEGDPDFDSDMARLYLAMKTDLDTNFNVQLQGIDQETGDMCAGVLKADHVRVIARKTLTFLMQPSFDASASDCAGITFKQNGDIIFLPSSKGIIKLGGDDAGKVPLCLDVGVTNVGGTVVAAGKLMTSMGGFCGSGTGSAQGVFATKVLIK